MQRAPRSGVKKRAKEGAPKGPGILWFLISPETLRGAVGGTWDLGPGSKRESGDQRGTSETACLYGGETGAQGLCEPAQISMSWFVEIMTQ